jgi:uncharacterized protein (DUF2249 family)
MTTATDAFIDVRTLPSGTCRDTIFRTLQTLEIGAALTLTVGHDPQPLRFYLDLSRPGDFAFDYLEEGPDAWRVRIRREA